MIDYETEHEAAHMAERKKKLRCEIKDLTAGLSAEYRRMADGEIFDHIVSLPEYERAATVFCFVGTDSEIDTVPILTDAWKKGKRVCVPKCVGKGIMKAYQICELEDLKEGSYGILEPSEASDVILPEEIDLVLAPCLSCGSDGKRLGYGGGYYDRYLERVAAPKAALCRKRLMREDIPVDVHDFRMDMVICEDGIMRIG